MTTTIMITGLHFFLAKAGYKATALDGWKWGLAPALFAMDLKRLTGLGWFHDRVQVKEKKIAKKIHSFFFRHLNSRSPGPAAVGPL